jgi:hypothetical protein
MPGPPSDLPEAAGRRFAEGGFSSGLSVPDFAACLDMGLEPQGLVQGFCAMQWGWYGVQGARQMMRGPIDDVGSAYSEVFRCPHGMRGPDHRSWGQNFEQTQVEAFWTEGFTKARARMIDEAIALGADGIVGVVDRVTELSDMQISEFHLYGTAVRVRGAAAPSREPWTTLLAGQRLAKIFEAGFAPVGVVSAVSSVRIWAYCQTEYLIEGRAGSAWLVDSAPQEIEQFVTARMAARDIVRRRARTQLDGDELHGVELEVLEREVLAGDWEVRCRLLGNRLRRVADLGPLPHPRPTVRLS